MNDNPGMPTTFLEWTKHMGGQIKSEHELQLSFLAWTAGVLAERTACGAIALGIETEGNPELYGDPDVPTPITRLIVARNDRP